MRSVTGLGKNTLPQDKEVLLSDDHTLNKHTGAVDGWLEFFFFLDLYNHTLYFLTSTKLSHYNQWVSWFTVALMYYVAHGHQ